MARLGLVVGSGARGLDLPAGDWVALQRHSDDAYILPHLIDHLTNMRTLVDAGCDRVLAIGSVGSLRPELRPGSFVCPEDFIAPGPIRTRFSDQRAHRVPGFDPEWRLRVAGAFAAAGVELHVGGIYWQAPGPRLETPAEIRLIARDADVIGMTIASECVAAGELGLAYASVCIVDNLANGVGEVPLTLADLEEGRAANREPLAAALGAVMPALSIAWQR
jgi:5'-methylthioinosine phosphorylase